ncbi:hypothetical protein EIP91_012269 [Steccherinum ochraceum]|uniref:RING-type domain-containing protein n=1 Tax=Steccherinum ochraceum TaxID=92696 RepID=A0A4R0RKB2_9APHY|nr:hypothetical protein EIP91_012269 [Steccherinum ochraceum]
MSSSKVKKAAKPPALSMQEIQQNYSRLQGDLSSLANKIGELEQEAEEHSLVLTTLDEALAEEPDRKCFRLVGGVLVERTVKDVVPALQTNRDGIRKVIAGLTDQYKGKEEEFETFKQDYNIRPTSHLSQLLPLPSVAPILAMVAFNRGSSSSSKPMEGPLVTVLQGVGEHVVSFPGRSQYGGEAGGGTAACGLAALNCARIILARERDGLKDVALLQEMLRKETLEDVLRICLRWSSTAHLDVDEIAKAPIFQKTLTPLWSQYAQPGLKQFLDMLIRLQNTATHSAALVLTRPPEIVCILKIVTERKNVWVLFDSHPRHKHPDGGAFIFYPSLEAIADYLADLFKFDPHLLADPALQWQAQLLANFCGHAFMLKDSLAGANDLQEAVLESSLEVLALKAEVTELKRTNGLLQAQLDHSSDENANLQDQVVALRHTSRLPSQPYASSVGSFPNVWRPVTSPKPTPLASSSKSQSTQIKALPSPPLKVAASPKGKMVMRTVDEKDDDDFVFATRIQLEWQDEEEGHDDSVLLAAQKQKEYEEEDRSLRAQMQDLQQVVPATFTCSVCMDEHSEYMIARVDPCGHEFCRDCVRGYLKAKLGEHRYPILCPVCSTDRDKTDPGTLSTLLVQQIGLSEEEFALFTEMELSAFSILLHCRK